MTHSHHDTGSAGHGRGGGHDDLGHDGAASDAGGADLLDLDGEVLQACWGEALDLVAAAATEAARAGGLPPARVVDLGAGTGTGALGLAIRLTGAEVVAVDVSASSLARVAVKAQAAGVGNRVRTVVADLDTGWPDLAPIDVTWASMSLHHLADPVGSLAELRRLTSPGGLLAVSEFDEPLRFLPDELGTGRAGFESRALEALSTVHAEALPNIGASWAAMLDEAGWAVVGRHDVVIDDHSPDHPLAGSYARAWFERLAGGLRGRLDADDERTLEALLDDGGPQAVLHRSDLHLHGIRSLTLARA